MSANHHTPVQFKAPVNSAVVNTSLGQLDQAITDDAQNLTDLRNGVNGYNLLRFTPDTTKEIAAGTVTITQSLHLIDTESAAASDEVETIAPAGGSMDGAMVFFQLVSASRVVTFKHNTSNIYNAGQADIVLNDTLVVIGYKYDFSNLKWVQICGPGMIFAPLNGSAVALTRATVPQGSVIGSGLSRRLAVMPDLGAQNWWALRASAAAFEPMGTAAWTTAGGTFALQNGTNGTFVRCRTGAASGNISGQRSTTFDLVRTGHNPIFECVIETPADISSIRYWIGLTSAAWTNSDTAPGHAAALRYSTVAGDGGWVGVTRDGITQSVTATVAAIAASTKYKLRVRVDETNGTIYFSVNDGTEVAATANRPTSTQDMGASFVVITQAAAVRDLHFGRLWNGYN